MPPITEIVASTAQPVFVAARRARVFGVLSFMILQALFVRTYQESSLPLCSPHGKTDAPKSACLFPVTEPTKGTDF